MGKKLESNFINMVLVLFIVSLFASVCVAYVQTLTEDTIAAAQLAKQVDAIKQVVPGEFDNDPLASQKSVSVDGKEVVLFPATKDGKLVGTAVKTFTMNGFGGLVELMVGFAPDGSISGYSVLSMSETPGLGSKMAVWFVKGAKGDVTGRVPGTTGLKVSKDGGDVDAITAATISSRAFLDAVNRAARVLSENNVASTAETASCETQSADTTCKQ